MITLLNEEANGVYIICATPFKSDGSIDYSSTDSLVEFYSDKGVSGITVLGMMGEADKMSVDETKSFMTYVVKRVNNRVPIIVGISAAGLNNLGAMAKASMDAGCCGVMIAPPNGLKTEEVILQYFYQVFDSIGENTPVCYQDYPQSTNTFISVETVNRLIREFDQFYKTNRIYEPILVWVRGDEDIRKTADILLRSGPTVLLRKFVLFNEVDKPDPRAGFYVSFLSS